MGCYIEPENESKHEFLNREGQEVSLEYIIQNYDTLVKNNLYPVCRIEHTVDIIAVPILYNKEEILRLLKTYGITNKNKYYIISLEKLRKVSSIDNFL